MFKQLNSPMCFGMLRLSGIIIHLSHAVLLLLMQGRYKTEKSYSKNQQFVIQSQLFQKEDLGQLVSHWHGRLIQEESRGDEVVFRVKMGMMIMWRQRREG
jgi:hypothetical protein